MREGRTGWPGDLIFGTFGGRGVDLYTIRNLPGKESVVATRMHYARYCEAGLKGSIGVLLIGLDKKCR